MSTAVRSTEVTRIPSTTVHCPGIGTQYLTGCLDQQPVSGDWVEPLRQSVRAAP